MERFWGVLLEEGIFLDRKYRTQFFARVRAARSGGVVFLDTPVVATDDDVCDTEGDVVAAMVIAARRIGERYGMHVVDVDVYEHAYPYRVWEGRYAGRALVIE